MGRVSKFSPEGGDRTVRLVFDQIDAHRLPWAAISAIAGKIGCTAQTLRQWVVMASSLYANENVVILMYDYLMSKNFTGLEVRRIPGL